MSTLRVLIVSAVAGVSVLGAATAQGSESGSYGGVLQPDGKIVAAGWGQVGEKPGFGLVRYLPDGSLDRNFGARGMVGGPPIGFPRAAAHAVALQPGGKIVAAGQPAGFRPSWNFDLTRYTSSGSSDKKFGRHGQVTTDFGPPSYSDTLVTEQDGSIVAAGAVLKNQNQAGFALARYHANGTLDTSFGSTGRVTTVFHGHCNYSLGKWSDGPCGNALAVAVQPDGKIVAAGSSCGGFCFFQPYPGDDIALARYNPDGTLDTSFGTGGVVKSDIGLPAEARSVALQPDGKIVVAGPVLVSGSVRDPHYEFMVARYSADGALDPSFGSGGVATTDFLDCGCLFPYGGVANAVALQPDGKILAGGVMLDPEPQTRGTFALARYNADGSPDTSFGEDGKVTTSLRTSYPAAPAESGDVITALALEPEGRIVSTGFSNYGEHQDQFAFGVARYEPDGTLDPSFGVGGKLTTDLTVCRVPKLKGVRLKGAKGRLAAAHCRAGKVTRKYSSVRKSRVAASKPGAGTVRPAGAKIAIVLSRGSRRA